MGFGCTQVATAVPSPGTPPPPLPVPSQNEVPARNRPMPPYGTEPEGIGDSFYVFGFLSWGRVATARTGGFSL